MSGRDRSAPRALPAGERLRMWLPGYTPWRGSPAEYPAFAAGVALAQRSSPMQMSSSELSISNQSDALRIAARGDANVLITGPTGSGKTRLARQIHNESSRRSRPFVTVNLATLHEGTFESELFGHERGAFTGAEQRRIGRLELAQGGTVFLDEVGDLAPRLQARLLEFLQSRTVSPLGSNRESRLNVRVITATNRDLRAAVVRKEFREDLFHRLRVVCIELKPLRSRRQEMPALIHANLSELAATLARPEPHLAPEVRRIFEQYRWPGKHPGAPNVLEYAVAAIEGELIERKHLPAWMLENLYHTDEDAISRELATELIKIYFGLSHGAALAQFEKEYLGHALIENDGKINLTARQIGLNKTTLLRRIAQYDLLPRRKERPTAIPEPQSAPVTDNA